MLLFSCSSSLATTKSLFISFFFRFVPSFSAKNPRPSPKNVQSPRRAPVRLAGPSGQRRSGAPGGPADLQPVLLFSEARRRERDRPGHQGRGRRRGGGARGAAERAGEGRGEEDVFRRRGEEREKRDDDDDDRRRQRQQSTLFPVFLLLLFFPSQRPLLSLSLA